MTHPHPRLSTYEDGALSTVGDRSVIRFERHLNHPVERVWRAISDPDEIVAWLAVADLDLVPGGRAELRWLNTDQGGEHAVARGVVTAVDPPHLLELDTDRHGLIRWELRPSGHDSNACLLTFTASVALPTELRLIVLAGWHTHLDFLAGALDGHAIDWPNWPRNHWEMVHDHYVETLGPDA